MQWRLFLFTASSPLRFSGGEISAYSLLLSQRSFVSPAWIPRPLSLIKMFCFLDLEREFALHPVVMELHLTLRRLCQQFHWYYWQFSFLAGFLSTSSRLSLNWLGGSCNTMWMKETSAVNMDRMELFVYI